MTAVIKAESPDHPDAVTLIDELQTHLGALYPVESQHGFSVQKLIDQKVAFFVLRFNGEPAGCGGIMIVGKEYGELKRMYVRPQFRGTGFGRLLIDHLANHARAQGVTLLRLETGIHQKAAIRMYERAGFHPITPFGPYFSDPLSQCFEKQLAGD